MDRKTDILVVRHVGWFWWTVSVMYAYPDPQSPETLRFRTELLRIYFTRAGARRYVNRQTTGRIMYEP